MVLGDVRFRVAKPTDRCVMTTIDLESLKTGKEPIRTLARHRLVDHKTMFAINLIPETAGRISVEQMVDLLATTPAKLFGFERKGAIEPGRDADIVVFDPAARRTIRAAALHHTSDYTPYEGLDAAGSVRDVFVRGRPVVRDGRFVGRRGFGQFVERNRAGEG